MSFLPENYNVPKPPSDYMKFEEGRNSFRILSSAIIGYEYWNNDRKPIRLVQSPNTKPKDIKLNNDGSYNIKHFWAFVVWNYQDKRIQILELTQNGIMQEIKALVDNPKWGDPKKYDIAITRRGEGLETRYGVQGEPPIGDPESEILEAFKNKPANLTALFKNEDPFASSRENSTSNIDVAVEDINWDQPAT